MPIQSGVLKAPLPTPLARWRSPASCALREAPWEGPSQGPIRGLLCYELVARGSSQTGLDT